VPIGISHQFNTSCAIPKPQLRLALVAAFGEEDDRDAKDSFAARRARLALKLCEWPDGWVSEILSKAISHLRSTSNLPTVRKIIRRWWL